MLRKLLHMDLMKHVKPMPSEEPALRLLFLSSAEVDDNWAAIASQLWEGDFDEVIVTCLGRHIAKLQRSDRRIAEQRVAIADEGCRVRSMAVSVLRDGGDRCLLVNRDWAIVLIPLKSVLEI